MSASWILIIPTDPSFVPASTRAVDTVKVAQKLFPDAAEIEAVETEQIEFIYAGANAESIHCPVCGAKINYDWWAEEVERAFEKGFASLHTTAPCCQISLSLNDLCYHWPEGFARWYISVRDAHILTLSEEIQNQLAATLHHPIRVVYRRM